MESLSLFDIDNQNLKKESSQILLELFEAYYSARKTKRSKASAIAFEFDHESKILALRDAIINKSYEPLASIAFINYKPVMREVFAAAFQDRVVHHFIFRHINPIFEMGFIEDSYSCRKGKGTLYGSKRISGFIKECSLDYTKQAYILKLDLEGYFYNIDKSILFKIIKKQLSDNRALLGIDFDTIMYLIEKTIFDNALEDLQKIGTRREWQRLPKNKSLFFAKEGKGLPIGNLTSQLFSNIYMNEFDRYVKDKLKIEYYGRYVDDFIVVHNSNEYLKSLIVEFREWLESNLGMRVHPKKIYLQPHQRGVKFLGSYIKPNVTYVDKRCKTNFYKLVYKINSEYMKFVDDMEYYKDIRAKINSYLGTLRNFSSFKLRKKIISKLLPEFWVCFGIDTEYKRVVLGCKYGFKNEQLLSSSHI